MTDITPGKPVFIVVGGSRGIGAAIATSAAEAGYAVLLTYASSSDQADAVVERIRHAGGTAKAVRADTSQIDDVSALFAAADAMGRLSVLVYSGGITGGSSRIVDADPAAIARVIEVNLTGAALCAREAAMRMSTGRGGEGGSIVLLSSRAAELGAAGMHVWYAASKGGVDSLTLGLARELGAEGIRVNAVSPGPVATDMLSDERKAVAASLVPMQRIGLPEEVAAAVMFLVSGEASFVSGANLAVSGGR